MDASPLTIVWNTAPLITFTRSTGSQNITGWTFLFTVRNVKGGTVILQKTNASFTITDAVNGIYTLQLLVADTSLLAYDSSYYYSVDRVDSGGEDSLANGILRVVYDPRLG